MKIALLGDTHFGARSDAVAFHDYYELFYKNVFFPYLKQHGIHTVVQFGDLFDRRKYVNFNTLHRARQYFFDELKANRIHLDVFVGNHDTFYKNTNEVNSPELLLSDYDNITVYTYPRDVYVGKGATKFTLIPWICADNYDQVMQHIAQTDSQILFGHLELAGFEMYRGTFVDHGMDPKLFDKFDVVCTGHYHHRSSKGNIHYLGTPYEMTWSDYNDSRGFHIFDTETRELEFVPNPYRIFNKIHYDDAGKEMSEVVEGDFESYRNTFVKVIVRNKTNPYWFDMFIDKLEQIGVIDLQVVDDHLHLDLEDDADIIDEAEDTLTILKKVVDGIDTKHVPKKDLDVFLTNLYSEALHAE